MLTPSQVVSYVKTQLGYPHNPLEYDDNEILNYIRMTTIPEFSKWIPDVKEIGVNFGNEEIQTHKQNEFLVIDEDGMPIIDVVEVLFDQGGFITAGFPVIGLLGADEDAILEYGLNTYRAGTGYKYSMMNYYYEFIKPNILRVTPNPGAINAYIKYERFHLDNFSTIPPEFTTYFLDLAFADVALWLCRTRSIFRTFNTPFGDIELNVEDLRSEAQETRNRILEELKTVNPSIIVDSG